MLKQTIYILFCIVLFLCSYSTYASNGEISSGVLKGESLKQSTISQLGISLPVDAGLTYNKVINKVVLKYTENKTLFLSTNWNLKVDVLVSAYDASGNSYQMPSKVSLSINGGTSGSLVSDIDTYVFQGAHKIVLRVLSVTSTDLPQVLPSNFSLEILTSYEVDYQSPSFQKPLSIYSQYHTDDNSIEFYWDGVSEEFDLEWAFVSSDITNLNFPSTPLEISRFDFQRVTVKGNSYRITNLYDEGFLYYRVRMVSRLNSSNLHRIEGPWNNQTTQRIAVQSIDNFRNSINSISYTDDGLRHETRKFIDGSLRTRQEQVKLNTENVVLITEQFYDYEGRLALSTVPSPTQDLSHSMEFVRGFSTYQLPSTQNAVTLNKQYFDISLDPCSLTTSPKLSTLTGSSHYYSAANTSTKNSTEYISNAEGYPYTQTIYDSEGRVKKQVGGGSNYILGSGHETEIIYAQPTQKQLDRMFGNEVGNVNHYSMKATKDVHGQLSLSYEDLSGRVIATSLVGDSPTNLEALDEQQSSVFIQDNFNDLNHYNEVEEAYIIETDFFVQKPSVKYTFNYGIDRGVYYSSCTSSNYDCVYDLSISIYDDCNRMLEDGNSNSDYYNGTNLIFNKVITINSINYQTPDMDVYFPKVGKYKVVKKLTLNQSALTNSVTNFRNSIQPSCVPSLATIEQQYQSREDQSHCGACIEGDASRCGELPAINMNVDCSDLALTLMADMIPGGQYFDNIKALEQTTKQADNAWLNKYVLENSDDAEGTVPSTIKYNDGTHVSTWNEVRSNWDDSWGTILLEYHPENHFSPRNCRINSCNLMSPSNNFDFTLSKLNNSYTIDNYIKNNLENFLHFMHNIDPFFASTFGSSISSNFGPTFKSDMENFLLVGENPIDTKNLYEEIIDLLNSQTSSTNNTDISLQCWGSFTSKYHLKKKMMFDNEINKSCPFLKDNKPNDLIADPTGDLELDKRTVGYYIRVMNTNDLYGNLVSTVTTKNVENLEDSEFGQSSENTTVFIENFDDTPTYKTAGLGIGSTDYQFKHLSVLSPGTYGIDNSQNLNYYNSEFCNGENLSTVIYDHTYNSSTGNYMLVDGNEEIITSPTNYTGQLKVWKRGAIPVVSGKKYRLTFWHLTFGNLQNQSIVGPNLKVVITYSTNQEVLDSKINFTSNQKTYFSWTQQEIDWVCPDFVTEIEISIVDYNGDKNYNDFALDDIQFKQVPLGLHPLDTKLIYNCLCNDLKIKTDDYMQDNPNSTTEDADLAISNYYNTEYYPNNPVITSSFVSESRAKCIANPEENIDLTMFPELYDGICAGSDVLSELDCSTETERINSYFANQTYEQAIEKKVQEFVTDYKQHCFKRLVDQGALQEDFKVLYSDQQYHYTLYYYDQAGNLVRTIPPGGVELLDNPTLTLVDNYRKSVPGSSFIQPAHRLESIYEYNSINQIVRKQVPDADSDNNITQNSKGYTQYFWYDLLGRVFASQTTKQKNVQPLPSYNYISYDALGRIRESGELNSSIVPNITLFMSNNYPNNWSTSKHEITTINYDNTVSTTINGYFGLTGQQNLRTRISAINYDFEGDGILDNASYYSYSEHGDVDTYISHRPDLSSLHPNGGIFKMRYKYDLITGKVKQSIYQQGTSDQFFHSYLYDKDNRITQVFTSKDGIMWDRDAKYFYYLHGPLARTEIGDKKVQGMDYAYTLQGWIKGVNSNILNLSSDIGQDGNYQKTSNIHAEIGSDVMGYVLSYNATDYKPIGATATNFTNDMQLLTPLTSGLYNGNISQVALAMSKTDGSPLPLQLTSYTYDQLNRFRTSTVYHSTSNYGAATSNGSLSMDVHYDPMGNILSMQRKGLVNNTNPTGQMDDLVYQYDYTLTNTGKNLKSNRLYHVNDQVNQTPEIGDIKDMGPFDASNLSTSNFSYDESGNLLSDKKEGIAKIRWTSSGKIQEIIRDEKIYINELGQANYLPDIEFKYDCFGRRILKIDKFRVQSTLDPSKSMLTPSTNWKYTYYVSDAQGNEMATYENKPFVSEGLNRFVLKEHYIYGSTRLGVESQDLPVNVSCSSDRLPYAQAIIKLNRVETAPSTLQITSGGVSITDPRNPPMWFSDLKENINRYKSSPDYTAFDDPNVAGQLIIQRVLPNQTRYYYPFLIKGPTNLISNVTFGLQGGELHACTSRRILGNKHYEIVNYLGNVQNVISDRKIPVESTETPGRVAYFKSQTVMFSDYYPFGQQVSFRTSSLESYSFAYNGMKLDNEVSGVGNSYTAEFWQMDPRLGRRWNLDPKYLAGESRYSTFSNNPIMYVDPLGDFRTKFGANVYKFFHGGEVSKAKGGESAV